MQYKTAKEIELAVANYFGWRKHIIVPNVSWGLLPYEADLLILSKIGYLYEIEIKVSKHDLLKDEHKHKWRLNDYHKMRKFWMAMPTELYDNCKDLVPDRFGILAVSNTGIVIEQRPAPIDYQAYKLSEKRQFQLARLGAMRIWNLKEILKNIEDSRNNRNK